MAIVIKLLKIKKKEQECAVLHRSVLRKIFEANRQPVFRNIVPIWQFCFLSGPNFDSYKLFEPNTNFVLGRIIRTEIDKEANEPCVIILQHN